MAKKRIEDLYTKIGHTPLVRIKNIKGLEENRVYAKIEGFNLTGSVKDRAVFQMLLDYKEEGRLKPHMNIVESTSGNTGIALSELAPYFKCKALIVMPTSMSYQRRELIQKHGGNLALVEGDLMTEGKKKVEETINKKPKKNLWLDQFNNPSNIKAHYLTTGPEIDAELKNIDYIILGIGSGGTIMGLAKYFKEKYPNIKVVGVEPSESPLYTKGVSGPHKIQGIGPSEIPSIVDTSLIDDFISVSGDASIRMAKEIYKKEDIYCGYSSGAALLAVRNYIKQKGLKNKTIVTLFPDKGDRYEWN
ncbi:MAG: cysteine synthase family protein [Coprobacillus sp.]|nr:cysteine synthase family protein [Coprobacillus sp.]